jgi:four helix bundle protein
VKEEDGDRSDVAAPLLDPQKLDVYRLAVEFQTVVAAVRFPGPLRDLRPQLARASASIVLNVAEGAGRRRAADKAQFYSIARGSAMECAAILDILDVRGAVQPELSRRGRQMLVRVVQMLSRLTARPIPDSRDV